MAKLHQGILGGFSGTVGTVIGYCRNNQWFMRAKPRLVANPRTEAQQAHRRQFGDMVSLASRLLPALKVGMRHYAPQHAMTAGNAFVHLNWTREGAISLKDMKLSVGPVPMVTFTEITVEDGVLTLKWDKNLHHHGAKNEDTIKIFAYSETLGLTQCVATAERRARRLSTLLPDPPPSAVPAASAPSSRMPSATPTSGPSLKTPWAVPPTANTWSPSPPLVALAPLVPLVPFPPPPPPIHPSETPLRQTPKIVKNLFISSPIDDRFLLKT